MQNKFKDIITSVSFDKNGTTVVIRNVPARIDEIYGDKYFSSEVNERLMAMVENSSGNQLDVVILDYATKTPSLAIMSAFAHHHSATRNKTSRITTSMVAHNAIKEE